LTSKARGRIAASAAVPIRWWLLGSELVQITTASVMASASAIRSRGNTCSMSPPAAPVRDTAITRASNAFALRATSRPIEPRPITHTSAPSSVPTLAMASSCRQRRANWSAWNSGRRRTSASSKASACSDTIAAFTPVALVTVTQSGSPMRKPPSMPAEVK
jgi:hypothetical protein